MTSDTVTGTATGIPTTAASVRIGFPFFVRISSFRILFFYLNL